MCEVKHAMCDFNIRMYSTQYSMFDLHMTMCDLHLTLCHDQIVLYDRSLTLCHNSLTLCRNHIVLRDFHLTLCHNSSVLHDFLVNCMIFPVFCLTVSALCDRSAEEYFVDVVPSGKKWRWCSFVFYLG